MDNGAIWLRDQNGLFRMANGSTVGKNTGLNVNSIGSLIPSAATARHVITTEASAYAAADFIFKTEVTDAMNRDNGICKLNGIHLLCKDSITAQIQVDVFSQNPTIASATNALYDISDAESVKKRATFVLTLGEASPTTGGNRHFYKPLHGMTIENDSGTANEKQSIWLAFIILSATTYTSTNGLSLILHREFR